MLKPFPIRFFLRIILLLFPVLTCLFSPAQKIQVSGFVKDKASGEGLVNAHVIEENSHKGTITNPYGFFSTTVNGPVVYIRVSYVGYKSRALRLECTKDTTVTIYLESGNVVEEVKVSARSNEIHSLTRTTGNVFFTGKELESIPGLFGERDILKSLQLMPGIQQGREGTSGVFVRGGDPGQNLILLDGVPVYNVNHLWGIFSVFTPEAVKSVDVYKGGFPARYGGRLSSVIDIRLKEGNLNDTKTDITIGTVAAKFLMEGPLKKGKSSYLLSARRTYADLLYTPINRLFVYEDMGTTVKTWNGYYFYDLNAKANFVITGTDRLYISAYLGSDKLYTKEKTERTEKVSSGGGSYQENIKYTSDFKNRWGNFTSSIRWNKIINPKFFVNTTFTWSAYNYHFGTDYTSDEKSVYDTAYHTSGNWNSSGVENLGAAFDFDYYSSPDYSLKFGAKALLNYYLPGKHQSNFRSSDAKEIQQVLFGHKINTDEFSVYAENHLRINNRISVNMGFNGLFYTSKGFNGLFIQPRLLGNLEFSDRLSLKAGYSKMAQPLHLLVNNSATYPVDIWVPAVKAFRPSVSHQVELGAYYSFARSWEMSSELYWKTMNGVLNYRNGESFFHLSDNWEKKVTSGKGLGYGLEVLLKKSTGKSTGWIGYNLSWAFRQFEELNHGKAFPFRYDTRHRLNVVLSHQLKENIDISVSWVLATGSPVTLSETVFEGEDSYKNIKLASTLEDYLGVYNPTRGQGKAIYYSGINNYRLPAYHRLDAGINFKKKKKYGERIWNISVYNVYNRNNPFFITYKVHDEAFHTPERGVGEYKNFSFFGILPSVSYRIKMD